MQDITIEASRPAGFFDLESIHVFAVKLIYVLVECLLLVTK